MNSERNDHYKGIKLINSQNLNLLMRINHVNYELLLVVYCYIFVRSLCTGQRLKTRVTVVAIEYSFYIENQ